MGTMWSSREPYRYTGILILPMSIFSPQMRALPGLMRLFSKYMLRRYQA